MLATCMARIGTRNCNEDLKHNSLCMYHKSLQELQKAINHPTLRCQEQTLATCIAMTMYEFAGGPAQRTYEYVTHYNGTMELLRLRGPKANGVGLGYPVFRALRMHSVGDCLHSPRPDVADS